MNLVILKVDPINPDLSKIKKATNMLRSGKIVAFPTDTVYGIGADPFNEDAIKQIFSAKGRNASKPLQVLISNRDVLRRIVGTSSEFLDRLASEFLPGALTLVVPARKDFPSWVRCGLDTIGVRMPANAVALRLIDDFGGLIAATSANVSGCPDPIDAQDVLRYLGDKVHLILDGGATADNVPSTVLDISVYPPVILRHGKLTAEEINRVLGKDIVF